MSKARKKKKPVKKKVVKKKSKPKTKSNKEIDSMWKEYEAILNSWKVSFDACQKIGLDAIEKYNELYKKAMKKDTQLLKKANDTWQKVWEEIGPQYIQQQGTIWENMLKAASMDSTSKLDNDWQKYWNLYDTKSD